MHRLAPLLFAVFITCAAYGAPIIAITPEAVDFGRIPQAPPAERTVTIANKGDAPLVIERIVSSCPCASLEMPPDGAIAPGASIDLPLRYDPAGREGEGAATVVIYSNDPVTPVAMIEVEVDVAVPLLIRPGAGLSWGMAPRGHELAKELTLLPGTPGAAIELIAIDVEQPGVSVRHETIERDGEQSVRAWFTLGPDVPLGMLQSAIRARVRVGGEELAVTIPFHGNVLGDLLLTPPAIISPRTAYLPGQRISEITVQSSAGGPAPEVHGAMASGPLRAVLLPGDDPTKRVIAVHAAEDAPMGPQAGRVFVMTSSVDEPIVAVPVYWRMGSAVVMTPDHAVLTAETPKCVVELRQADTHALTVRDVRFEAELVAVTVERAKQEGEAASARLVIERVAGADPAVRSTVVVIETDQPGAQALTVPVLLAPGKTYTLSLNSAYHINISSEAGVPLAPVGWRLTTAE